MKKLLKRTLAMLLAAVLVFGVAPLSGFEADGFNLFSVKANAANEQTEGYYTYTVDSKGNATITDVDTSISGDIVIPSTLGGHPVKIIGDSAFYFATKITSVVIPEGVTEIGFNVFSYCTVLKSISIPASAEDIDSLVYSGTSALVEIKVDKKNKYFSSDENGVFFDKNKTELIIYPKGKQETSYTIPNTVKELRYNSFKDCKKLESIVVPNSVKEIGGDAFYGCVALADITIGNGVTYFGEDAFYNTAYYNNPDHWENGVFYIDQYLVYADPQTVSGAYKIKEGTKVVYSETFANCTKLTSITIPESVKIIERGAFKNCSSLKTAVIGNGVTEIGDYAFAECIQLVDVSIGSAVNRIGEFAFYQCSVLNKIIIPNGVSQIGYEAFANCDKLSDITIPDSVKSIGDYAFYDTAYYNNTENWESGVLYIGNKLIKANNKDVSGDYKIKSGTQLVADGAFINCDKLTSITIPESVSNIGIQVFDDGFWNNTNCDSLKNIIVDSGNKYYSTDNNGVLFNKNKTVLYYYPAGLTLESYKIPLETKVIEDYAFCNCKNIKYICLSENVRKIGYGAIYKCDALIEVSVYNSNTNNSASTQPNGGATYNYDTDLESHAISACRNLKSIVLPEGIATIGSFAFATNYSLESIVLPKTTKTLGNRLFEYCKKLPYVIIPNGATTIEWTAFDGCESLEFIHIPSTVNNIENAILANTTAYICSNTKDCYAKTYADENNIEFRVCDNHGAKCDCKCHDNGIAGFFYRILLFFQSLFGLNKTCVCGTAHY